MFNRKIVTEVLKSTLTSDLNSENSYSNTAAEQDSIISVLIHDIFGGEILKTPEKNGWHFYNRIDGEHIDFSKSEPEKSDDKFEDIPATPDETSVYFDKNDYSTFFTKFITAFEETVGLGRYRYGLWG